MRENRCFFLDHSETSANLELNFFNVNNIYYGLKNDYIFYNNNPSNNIMMTDNFDMNDMNNKALSFFQRNLCLKTFDDSSKALNIDDSLSEDKDKLIIDKISKESIQNKIKENIHLKKPFKEKKKLGRKIKSNENLGEHNKFSDDNVQRRLKNGILMCVLEFINKKIKYYFSNGSIIPPKNKLLFKLKQKPKEKAKAEYNKKLLNRTLGSIFSEEISTKYTRYSPNHNKEIIENLLNEKDVNKKEYFNNLFNLTFIDVLNHFRGTTSINILSDLKTFEEYFMDLKLIDYGDEYKKILKFYLMNYEYEVMNKRSRVSNVNKKIVK